MLRSGSTLSPWAIRSQSTDFNSLQLITTVGCYHENVNYTLQCLQGVDVKLMLDAWRAIAQDDLNILMSPDYTPQHYNHPFLAHTYFTPVIDRFMQAESIIPGYIEDLIDREASKPLMIGTVSAECTGYGMLVSDSIQNYHASEVLDMNLLVPKLFFRNVAQVHEAARKKYISPFVMINSSLGIDSMIQLISDQSFVAASLKEAATYSKNGADVFLYQFNISHRSVQHQYASYGLLNYTAAPHGVDLLYLLESSKAVDGNTRNLHFSSPDRLLIGHLADHVANFVKHGHPASDKKWPKFRHRDWAAVKVYTWEDETKPASRQRLSNAYTFWHDVIPALDEAIFRQPASEKGCKGPGGKPPLVTTPFGRRYKYPFFIAIISCAVLLLTTCALAFVHFGRNKNVTDV